MVKFKSALPSNFNLSSTSILTGFDGKLDPIRNPNIAGQSPRYSKAATPDASANALITKHMSNLETQVTNPAAVEAMRDIIILAQSPDSTQIGQLAEQKAGFKDASGNTIKTPTSGSVGDYLKVLSDPTINANHKAHTNVLHTNTTSDPANTQVHILNTGPDARTTVIAKQEHINQANIDRTQQSLPATTPSSEVKHNDGKSPSNTTNTVWSSLRNAGTAASSTFLNQWWFWVFIFIIFIALAWGMSGRNGKKRYPYNRDMTINRSSPLTSSDREKVAEARKSLSQVSF